MTNSFSLRKENEIQGEARLFITFRLQLSLVYNEDAYKFKRILYIIIIHFLNSCIPLIEVSRMFWLKWAWQLAGTVSILLNSHQNLSNSNTAYFQERFQHWKLFGKNIFSACKYIFQSIQKLEPEIAISLICWGVSKFLIT